MAVVRRQTISLGKVAQKAVEEVRRALRRGALKIENTAVDGIISPPKTGRVYQSKYRKGAKHQASAPGEFPAADSGRLHQSITTAEASTGGSIRFETGSNVDYGPHLEFGTVNMEPRPFMKPAFDQNIEAVRQDVRAAVRRGSKK